MSKTPEGRTANGNVKRIVVGLAAALALAAILLATVRIGGPNTSPAPGLAEGSAAPYRVYYFHRTVRCPSCEKIETLAQAAVEERFADEVAAGRMMWKPLNIDEPQNQHFEDDYKLETQSVVLSELREGKEVRWKNLDKVWDLLDDDAGFAQYVAEEIAAFQQGK